MNIEYIRNFIKLAQFRSFSKLANELPISQSTLSHQISQLEKDFGGIVLIDRSTKKFELTKAGKLLLKYGEQIIDIYDKSRLEISKFKDQVVEDIIISASTIPGSHILPRFIAEFRYKNPDVNFKILINNSKKSIENLRNEMADFAGIGSFMNYNERDFDCIKIGEDEFKFICSTNHELLKEGNLVDFNQLIKYPFVWREKGSGMRNTFKQQFPDYKELDFELEINDNDSIISTVSESNYISIMSEMMADKAESAGLIKSLKIKKYPVIAKRPLFFIKLKEKQLSKLKKKFWDEIKSKSKKNEKIGSL
ncbi:MAG: LysR family transcriptional regulator [Candidatus Lokiarchaeota archaeon]|nr:LysR family transcriptional regulator [Candidatus Lokiarchaeota archaeon]